MPSSVISYYHYDSVAKTLIITFVSGMVYHYKNVPKAVYDRMKAVTSKGIFLNKFIKDKYEFERVE
jgi:KTSC domain